MAWGETQSEYRADMGYGTVDSIIFAPQRSQKVYQETVKPECGRQHCLAERAVKVRDRGAGLWLVGCAC